MPELTRADVSHPAKHNQPSIAIGENGLTAWELLRAKFRQNKPSVLTLCPLQGQIIHDAYGTLLQLNSQCPTCPRSQPRATCLGSHQNNSRHIITKEPSINNMRDKNACSDKKDDISSCRKTSLHIACNCSMNAPDVLVR